MKGKGKSGEGRPDAAIHKLPGDIALQIAAAGVSFVVEKNLDRLKELILLQTMKISNADGGALYSLDTENQVLQFECIRNHSLNISLGGATGEPIPFPPVQIFKDGKANDSMGAVHVALNNVTLNIGDMMDQECKFGLWARDFNKRDGYPVISMLVVPVRDRTGEAIGVLQLTNALDPDDANWKPIPFSEHSQLLVESLAEQAGAALCNLMKHR